MLKFLSTWLPVIGAITAVVTIFMLLFIGLSSMKSCESRHQLVGGSVLPPGAVVIEQHGPQWIVWECEIAGRKRRFLTSREPQMYGNAVTTTELAN